MEELAPGTKVRHGEGITACVEKSLLCKSNVKKWMTRCFWAGVMLRGLSGASCTHPWIGSLAVIWLSCWPSTSMICHRDLDPSVSR